tara:strand:- start:3282 stop:4184 length:903 start_codon:yes stop_codon:yes gene_type:complete
MATSDTIAKSLLNQNKEAKKAAGQVAPGSTGIDHTPSLGANPAYNIREAENIIQGKEGTIIIFGRDRPGSETSGTGATTATNVGRIDIIAGLSGPLKRETDNKGAKVATNPSTELDSARIYITERAKDIDSKEYFGLAKGNVGYLSNRSAIAVKADSVRIIGREGIKLVTSSDTRNGASGLFIGDNIQGVDIIAGNDDSGLQPMVKGDDLAKVLDNLLELIQDVQASVSYQSEVQMSMAGALVDPTGASAGKLGQLLARLPIEISNLACQERNFAFHKMNYSDKNPFAKFNFRSKYNHVN